MTFDLCSRTSSTNVKELTPEFYSDPTFLMNSYGFNLGVCANGEVVNDVILPPWADGSPQKFVKVMRDALEGDICSKMLPTWIDLIFGISSRGSEARKAHNIFYHLTYIEPSDLDLVVRGCRASGLHCVSVDTFVHFGGRIFCGTSLIEEVGKETLCRHAS